MPYDIDVETVVDSTGPGKLVLVPRITNGELELALPISDEVMKVTADGTVEVKKPPVEAMLDPGLESNSDETVEAPDDEAADGDTTVPDTSAAVARLDDCALKAELPTPDEMVDWPMGTIIVVFTTVV